MPLRGSQLPEPILALFHELFDQGVTFIEMADRLGMSRNAVIGHAYRMGLKRGKNKRARPPTPWRTPRTRKRKPSPPAVVPHMLGVVTLPTVSLPAITHPIAFDDLDADDCRFPVDVAGQQMYCGAVTVASQPYCLVHCRICYAR